ncbi:hypothetical protein CEXT_185961 [Caerostris extrusa]|uniref:Uncharacterized protein n=1 Tax=Caerostris extrusa TaxID=172846 RepID=A0AAV4MH58_CAEEX|nr:hypothetical protein CEXT_185961 [Caerostris extrusa]
MTSHGHFFSPSHKSDPLHAWKRFALRSNSICQRISETVPLISHYPVRLRLESNPDSIKSAKLKWFRLTADRVRSDHFFPTGSGPPLSSQHRAVCPISHQHKAFQGRGSKNGTRS